MALLRRIARAGTRRWLRLKERVGLQPVTSSGEAQRRGNAGKHDSFSDLVDNRVQWLYDHLPPESARYHYYIYTKDDQKRVAKRLGLEVAETYRCGVPLENAISYIEEYQLERFAIKPNSSRGAIGCRCVVREGKGLLDLRTGKRYRNVESLRRDLLSEYSSLKREDRWIVEELLLSVEGSLSLTDDYKLYCFAGVVEVILHKKPLGHSGETRNRFYTRDWMPVDVGLEETDQIPPGAPLNGRRLIEVAEHASSQLCYPFIRMDLYDTSRGIVFGEFTPGPGRAHEFNAEWNERLCKRWFEAAEAIKDGLRSGSIQPLYPEPTENDSPL